MWSSIVLQILTAWVRIPSFFYQLQGVFFVNIDLLSKKNMSPVKIFFVVLLSFKGFQLALDFL